MGLAAICADTTLSLDGGDRISVASCSVSTRANLDLTLIDNELTTWQKDDTITLAVKHASVESAGSFGLPQSFNSTSWDDSCRITVVLELDNMQSCDDENGTRKTWLY